MIFRQTKTLLFSLILSSLFIANISTFAESKNSTPSELATTSTVAKTENKPTTDQIADKINENTTVDNTLLIKVKDGEDTNSVKNELKDEISSKLKIDKKNIADFDANDDQVVALQFGDTAKLKDGFKIASNNSKIEVAQPNYRYKKMYTPNDADFSYQWYLKNQASGTNTQTAWDAVGAKAGVTCGDTSAAAKRCGGETSVKIAVIDSGLNTAVADFAGASIDTANSMRFFNNPNGSACPVNQTYLPANGLINGWQFCQSIGTQFDEDGHGTGVSSIIMSQDNAVGTVGIAHNTTLLPIALHNDTFNTFFISEAIKYAQNKGAKVINLSLGTPYYDSFLENTITSAVNAGVTVVAASGNCAIFTVASCDWDGSGTLNQPEEANNTPMYPAAFANVIAVGASNYANSVSGITRSCYSNYGSYIDIVAPVGDTGSSCNSGGGSSVSGVRIPCGVVRTGCPTVDTFYNGAGTSYAAPMVAAAVGLLKSQDSTLNASQIRDLLLNTATDIGPSGRDDAFGYGILNTGNMTQTIGANYVATHYFPWYGTTNGGRAWTMVGNPSVSASVKIKVYYSMINQSDYKVLGPGESYFFERIGLVGGPIIVSSEMGAAIYSTQRVFTEYKSSNELVGIKPSEFQTKFYFPWYGTSNNDHAWTMVGNPSTTTNANITIKLAGTIIRTATIAPGGSLFDEKLNQVGGPIVVESDIPIYSTQRVFTQFKSSSEFKGIKI
jgi:serine protease